MLYLPAVSLSLSGSCVWCPWWCSDKWGNLKWNLERSFGECGYLGFSTPRSFIDLKRYYRRFNKCDSMILYLLTTTHFLNGCFSVSLNISVISGNGRLWLTLWWWWWWWEDMYLQRSLFGVIIIKSLQGWKSCKNSESSNARPKPYHAGILAFDLTARKYDCQIMCVIINYYLFRT